MISENIYKANSENNSNKLIVSHKKLTRAREGKPIMHYGPVFRNLYFYFIYLA